MRRIFRRLYLALVIVLPLCVVFQSMLGFMLSFGRHHILMYQGQFVFYVEVDPSISEFEHESVLYTLTTIEGVETAQVEQNIPPWSGAPELEEQWNQMWKKYLSPVILVFAEPFPPSIERLPDLAREIQAIQGVVEVSWDTEGYESLKKSLEVNAGMQRYFNLFSFAAAAMILFSLVFSFPVRFRRRYVVLTGSLGAGSQIKPEWVLLRLVLGNVFMSTLLVVSVFSVAYWFLPVHGQFDFQMKTFPQAIECILINGVLVLSVFSLGWWLPAEELQTLSSSRPLYSEW